MRRIVARNAMFARLSPIVATLLEIVGRPPPQPWDGGDNLPWHEREFSERMLKEHLSQAHDKASRRTEIIDQHVAWIHQSVLSGNASRILDLGCGPGLYTSRLAKRGHDCAGIDYSPASIEYARNQGDAAGLSCAYVCKDIRTAAYGNAFDLVLLISGELNVFSPKDAKTILNKAQEALVPGGILALEAHTFEAIQAIGMRPPFWYSSESGLFSSDPHLCLQEQSWHGDTSASTVRYFVVDALTNDVRTYAQTFHAYGEDGYRTLLLEAGFADIEFLPSLTGGPVASASDLQVAMCRKGG